jgi:putative ABC transport system permease protein
MRLRIVWRNLTAKPLQSSIIVVIVALAIALTVTLLLLAEGLHQGLVWATEPFDLIVGAKGSPVQLVLNTVFLQDNPIGNIPAEIVAELQGQPGVAAVIPLGFGDNYRGYRIIGTTAAIFRQETTAAVLPWLQLAAGRIFSAPFEAVIGAKVVQDTGLKLGDEFASIHGLSLGEQGEQHREHPYQVVGILKTVGGPYDQAILVPLPSIWKIHKVTGILPKADDGHEHGVTAILVKPKGYADAMRLYQQFQTEPRAQLIFPAQTIIQFFALMGQGEQILQIIANVVIAITLLTVALALYWSALGRSRDQAILRAIGASSGDLFRLILLEGTLLVVLGVCIGLMTGHGLFLTIAGILQQKTAITIGVGGSWQELYLALGTVGLGMLASIVPAALAYRFDVARSL